MDRNFKNAELGASAMKYWISDITSIVMEFDSDITPGENLSELTLEEYEPLLLVQNDQIADRVGIWA